MSNKLYLGIDTSNYTTSLALANEDGEIIANIKKILQVDKGERGLRQSDAVFSHIKNLPTLADDLRLHIGSDKIEAIGVSVTPRDAEGSYMPCFMAGRAVAHVLAATHNVPVYEYSHQCGHIMAALYSSNQVEHLIDKEFIAFHVSGGTTEAVLVKPSESGFKIEILAETADISAGQAIDRIGVMMGLQFPCGKELETIAKQFTGELPKLRICVNNGKCNMSGIENQAKHLYEKSNDKPLVATFVLDFISRTLIKITTDLREKYPLHPILYAGGVMSNEYIQYSLSCFENTYFATPEFSADNAAGIALLTRKSSRS